MSKLTNKDLEDIKMLLSAGRSIKEVSSLYDVSHQALYKRLNKEPKSPKEFKKAKNKTVSKIVNNIIEQDRINDRPIHININNDKNEESIKINNNLELTLKEKQLAHSIAISETIFKIEKGLLNLHGMAVMNALNKAKTGDLQELAMTRIGANVGNAINILRKTNGISNEKQDITNIQINNNAEENKLKINFVLQPVQKIK
jgi:predicted DNA-binding protein YlxM (UPF0122 family)